MSSRLPDTTARDAPPILAVLLREPFMALTERVTARLAERGHPEVRPAHGNVFGFLDDTGTRVGVLAERAQVTRQSMSELVAHLERHGYVEQVADPSDRRARLVRATDRGREVFALARQVNAEIEEAWTKHLGEARMAALRESLEMLASAP